ncbi:hypothetical protein O3Q52_25120 [Streptomyces sp. ActVer]|uniref:hypothetical protein n=1 Tax=Streptomyces sp. ActVer TaxID=3014558 RepID=UPI0022B30CDC|nr:hypothetical protein [Streptomyces sp. ActVer]MCZ4511409.1 hypothetical protein [Streptomyces sp. ActVer]
MTGCSDSGSDSGSGKDDKAAGKEPAAAAKTLGKSELEKLVIATADVKGFKVGPADQSDQFASSKEEIKVVDEKCAPLAYVLTGFAPGDSASYVNRMAQEDPTAKASASPTKDLEDMTEEEMEDAMNSITDALGSTVTLVSLSSYEGDGAKETMSSLRRDRGLRRLHGHGQGGAPEVQEGRGGEGLRERRRVAGVRGDRGLRGRPGRARGGRAAREHGRHVLLDQHGRVRRRRQGLRLRRTGRPHQGPDGEAPLRRGLLRRSR